jgi:hypothetical protein
MDNPESWKISTEERLKHNASFMQLNPINGAFLTGKSIQDIAMQFLKDLGAIVKRFLQES